MASTRQDLSPQALVLEYEMPQKVVVTKGWLTDREEESLSEGDRM